MNTMNLDELEAAIREKNVVIKEYAAQHQEMAAKQRIVIAERNELQVQRDALAEDERQSGRGIDSREKHLKRWKHRSRQQPAAAE